MGRGTSKAAGTASGSNVRETAQDFIKRVIDDSSAEHVTIRVTANDMVPIIGNRDKVLKVLNSNKDNLYVRSMQYVDYNNVTIECVYHKYK